MKKIALPNISKYITLSIIVSSFYGCGNKADLYLPEAGSDKPVSGEEHSMNSYPEKDTAPYEEKAENNEQKKKTTRNLN